MSNPDYTIKSKSSRSAANGGREHAPVKPKREPEKNYNSYGVPNKTAEVWKSKTPDNKPDDGEFNNKTELKTENELISAPDLLLESFIALPNSPAEPRSKKKPLKIEKWLQRRGHGITFALLYLFTLVLYFRPYELIPALSGFSSIAWFLAIGTILVFIPSQIAAENTLTARPSEVNYVLLLTVCAIITIPIARSPQMAWASFNDTYSKVVMIFIVMVNVVRTEQRLKQLIWLAFAVGIMLAYFGINNYATGNLTVEGYRSSAQVAGMFGNPNSLALHFVIMTPIAVVMGLATRNYLLKIVYFGLAVMFVGGNVVTFSRGGFLGLLAASLVMAWKLGRGNRVQVLTICIIIGAIFIAVAPGNYGVRILSIFIPGLDPVGSSNERSKLLETSIWVTLRNPWGIGMDNFTLTNPRGLVTHNSYTQISSELGVAALYCYIMLIFNPIRRLFWIEREMVERGEKTWFYYMTIGFQASFAGWCIASFFDAAAYLWFLYYLVAYAVCLRRVYQLRQDAAAIENPMLTATA